MATSTLLVTGSTGFIGSHLVARLLTSSPGRPVTLLVRPTGKLPAHIESRPGVRVVRLDCRTDPVPASLLAGVETVYHVAGTMTDWARRSDFELGNVVLTQQLVDAALTHLASPAPTLTRFVHVSTADVYGHPGTRPDETAALDGASLPFGYAATKTRADQIVQAAHQTRGLPAVILRPATVYGPGSRDVVAEIATLLSKRSMLLISGGRARAGLVYIDDMVDALLLAASTRGIEGEAFNVCGGAGDDTGGDITWRAYCDLIADELGVPRASRSVPFGLALGLGRLFEAAYALARSYSHRPLVTRMAVYVTGRSQDVDVTKAREQLSFRARTPVTEGVRRSVAWWRGEQGQGSSQK